MTLGAYAGTVMLPLAKEYADSETSARLSGLVSELWAGLPLVTTDSHIDGDMAAWAEATTVRPSPDITTPAHKPADLVPDMLDLVHMVWQVARTGTPEELMHITRFRLSEIAVGLDQVYAAQQGVPLGSRPGTLEEVLLECFNLVARQRDSGVSRALTNSDLYDHGIAVGNHLVECLKTGGECKLLTTPQVDLLYLQVAAMLGVAGFIVLDPQGEPSRPGLWVEGIDDVDLSLRHISINWRLAAGLRERCSEAVNSGDYNAPILRQAGAVAKAVSRAVLRTVHVAGFTAHIDATSGEHNVIVTGLNQPEEFAAFIGSADPRIPLTK